MSTNKNSFEKKSDEVLADFKKNLSDVVMQRNYTLPDASIGKPIVISTGGEIDNISDQFWRTHLGINIGNPYRSNIQYIQGIDPFDDAIDRVELHKKQIKEELKKKMQFDDIIKEVKQWKVKK